MTDLMYAAVVGALLFGAGVAFGVLITAKVFVHMMHEDMKLENEEDES